MTYPAKETIWVFQLIQHAQFGTSEYTLQKITEVLSFQEGKVWIDNLDERYKKFVILPVYEKP